MKHKQQLVISLACCLILLAGFINHRHARHHRAIPIRLPLSAFVDDGRPDPGELDCALQTMWAELYPDEGRGGPRSTPALLKDATRLQLAEAAIPTDPQEWECELNHRIELAYADFPYQPSSPIFEGQRSAIAQAAPIVARPVKRPDRNALLATILDDQEHSVIGGIPENSESQQAQPVSAAALLSYNRQLQETLRQHDAELKACWPARAAGWRGPARRLMLHLDIDAVGEISQARITESASPDDLAPRCILSIIQNFQLPPPASGALSLNYPFIEPTNH
jgi:hypothetical protein